VNPSSLHCASASPEALHSIKVQTALYDIIDAIRKCLFSLGISLAALDFHHDALDALKNLPPQQNKLLLTERV